MSLFSMILHLLVDLLIIVAANIYIPKRLGHLFGLKRKRFLYLIFIGGTISFLITLFSLTATSHLSFGLYYLVSSSFIGFMLYLLVLLICFEIINFFFKFQKIYSGVVILSLALVISVYSIWHSRSFEISRIEIPIKSLQNELNIMHLSDIHLGFQRGADYLESIVTETNSLKPDLVLIPGDIIDSRSEKIKELLSPLANLESPTFFTYGNHDYYVGLDKVITTLEENNVIVIQNEIVITNGIQLIGLNYMNADSLTHDVHQVNDKTIAEVLPTLDISPDLPAILMHHSPVGVEYMNQHNVDFVITGHTHAGQVFPATLLTELLFPYNKGLHKYKDTYIYISQGAGAFVLPMRLGTINEITLIRLTKN